MSWFRVDDNFWCHPKVVGMEEREGPQVFAQAVTVWLLAGTYCSKYETGGLVSMKQLRRITPFSPVRASKALVRAGLWGAGGKRSEFRFHDWEDYRPKNSVDKSTNKSTDKSTNKSTDKSPKKSTHKSPKKSTVPPAESLQKRDTPEPVPDPVRTPPPCSPPEGDRQTRADYAFEQGSELCRIFAERFRTEKPRTAPPRTLQQPDHPVWQKLGLAVWDQAEAEGAERHAVLRRALERFFGDDWAARSGFPPNALLNAWAKWSSPDSDLDDRAADDDWQVRWDALQEEHSDALTRGGPIAAKALEPRFEALRRERRERLSA